jgi:tetratricopeptide (TPR) repeat protein
MLAHQKRGEGHLELKNIEQCVANFGRAVEIAEKLLEADPRSFQAKRDLALANRKFAQALDAAGNGRESLEKLDVALRSFGEMAAADPNNTEYPYDVANTRFVIGETHVSLGDHEAALQSFRQARKEFEAVQARNPQNIYSVRMLSFNFDRTAKAYVALAQNERREEFLRAAIENWQLALAGFHRLKEAGQMAEYDAKAIGETEAEIAKAEALLRGD